jgi:hypothetical protein
VVDVDVEVLVVVVDGGQNSRSPVSAKHVPGHAAISVLFRSAELQKPPVRPVQLSSSLMPLQEPTASVEVDVEDDVVVVVNSHTPQYTWHASRTMALVQSVREPLPHSATSPAYPSAQYTIVDVDDEVVVEVDVVVVHVPQRAGQSTDASVPSRMAAFTSPHVGYLRQGAGSNT